MHKVTNILMHYQCNKMKQLKLPLFTTKLRKFAIYNVPHHTALLPPGQQTDQYSIQAVNGCID